MRISVYCASSDLVHERYYKATEQLARIFVEAKAEVLYGGGAVGLMGQLADTIIKGGGRITGVIPRFMRDIEWAHPGVSDMIVTESMAERKAILMDRADAVVALPGGSGTLEELIEAITMKRLGRFLKPIVILNTEGYYDPLQELFQNFIHESFMDPRHAKMWDFVRSPVDVLPAIHHMSEWSKDAIGFASAGRPVVEKKREQ